MLRQCNSEPPSSVPQISTPGRNRLRLLRGPAIIERKKEPACYATIAGLAQTLLQLLSVLTLQVRHTIGEEDKQVRLVL